MNANTRNTLEDGTAKAIVNLGLKDRTDLKDQNLRNQNDTQIEQINSIKEETLFKKYRNELNSEGLHLQDPLYLRVLIKAGVTLDDIKQLIKTFKF